MPCTPSPFSSLSARRITVTQTSEFLLHSSLLSALKGELRTSLDRQDTTCIACPGRPCREPRCPLPWGQECLPVPQRVEWCPCSQAEQLQETWWKPHCLVHRAWFTPPRYWILICYICLLDSAFLVPFLRMKSRLFRVQSKNRSVIKFSFSFSFEAFMPWHLFTCCIY